MGVDTGPEIYRKHGTLPAAAQEQTIALLSLSTSSALRLARPNENPTFHSLPRCSPDYHLL